MSDARKIPIPPSWKVARIVDVADINPRLDKAEIDDQLEVSFVPMPAVEADTGHVDVSCSRPFGEVRKGYTPFLEGDVLFAKITPCMENGKMAVAPRLINGHGFGSTEFHVLRPLGGISAKFLYYFVSSDRVRHDAEHNMTGAVGQRRVPTNYLAEYSIPIPPVAEQYRIVSKIEELLSEIDKGVESLKTACEQLTIYRHAVLKHAFEGKLTAQWRSKRKDKAAAVDQLLEDIGEARKLTYERQLHEWQAALRNWSGKGQKGKRPMKPTPPSDVSEVGKATISKLPAIPDSWKYVRLATIAQIGSGMSVSKARAIIDPIEVPYLRVANVQRGALDLSHITTMKIERAQLSLLALKQWDILFNEGGDRDKLGRGWVWESQIDPCITQNHVFRVSAYLPSASHSKYISHWGNTFGQKYFNSTGKQTTNLASINKTVLSDFPIPLAPIEEQAEILKQLDAQLSLADALEGEIDTSLTALTALRQSILKKAFSGQLVAQNTNDEAASILLERIKIENNGGENKKNNSKKEAA